MSLIIHEDFHKLVFLEQSVGSADAAHLVELFHSVGFDAGMIDDKGHWFLHVCTCLHGCGMIGQECYSHWFVPCLHLIIYRFHDAPVEIFYGAQFEVEVAVMSCLVACFHMQEDEVVVLQGFDGCLCLSLVVGVVESGSAIHHDDLQSSIMSYASDKIHGRDDGSGLHLGIHLGYGLHRGAIAWAPRPDGICHRFAFSLALLCTREMKGVTLFRSIFFMPNLIGGIVLGYIWNLMINGVLSNWGVDISYATKYGFWGLVVLTNWQLIGYMMVIYIAGLQNIPGDLIEAAQIDGAGPIKTLFKIKIPMVMPSITICMFLTLTNTFKMFDQNLALTAGAPNRTTEMLALNIYNTFYGRIGWQGVGQAKAVVFFIIVAIIAFVQLKLTNTKEVES